LKDGAAASEQFQSILTRRGEVPASMLFPLSHLGNARAAVLKGDEAEARKSYGEMLAMWKDADPDLTPLKEARLESSRLNGSEN
jgi:uncharacterized membrane-anchored protein